MTQKKYHFISGLPRAGSTLIGAILRQNPRFSAGMSSPVGVFFDSIISQVSAGSELSRMVNAPQRERILRGVFDSYYAETEADVVFDTNRNWTARIPELMALYPEAKFICCVRNVAWVMDSLERQFRGRTFENTGLFNNSAERATVYTRTEALAAPNRLVGLAYQSLREACWSEFADRLVIVDYDILVERPKDVLKLIYEFIGEEPFEHNFENVEFDAPEFDEQLGLDGLHRVRPKVETRSRKTVLPPDVFSKFERLAFWQDLKNCAAFRIVPTAQEAEAEGSSD